MYAVTCLPCNTSISWNIENITKVKQFLFNAFVKLLLQLSPLLFLLKTDISNKNNLGSAPFQVNGHTIHLLNHTQDTDICYTVSMVSGRVDNKKHTGITILYITTESQ